MVASEASAPLVGYGFAPVAPAWSLTLPRPSSAGLHISETILSPLFLLQQYCTL